MAVEWRWIVPGQLVIGNGCAVAGLNGVAAWRRGAGALATGAGAGGDSSRARNRVVRVALAAAGWRNQSSRRPAVGWRPPNAKRNAKRLARPAPARRPVTMRLNKASNGVKQMKQIGAPIGNDIVAGSGLQMPGMAAEYINIDSGGQIAGSNPGWQ